MCWLRVRAPMKSEPPHVGCYGFTAEELDFILNYDIKYRLGRDTSEEE